MANITDEQSPPPSPSPDIKANPVPADYVITERKTLDGSAGTVVAQAKISDEKVASRPYAYAYSLDYAQTLPNPTDRFMRDFGPNLYTEDMQTDPQVYSTTEILNMAIFADAVTGGVTMTPAKHSKPLVNTDDPDYPMAVEIAEFAHELLQTTKRPFIPTMAELSWKMLTSGHGPGELVWEVRATDPAKGPRVMLQDVKPRPNRNLQFVVDKYYNTLGLLNVTQGTVFSGILPTDALNGATGALADNFIPRAKFVIPTLHARDGDPRGRSHLASVYTPWWKKQQNTPLHLQYLTRFGQPSVDLELPPDAENIDVLDANGQPTGEQVPVVTYYLQQLEAMVGGGVLVRPNGSNFQMHQATGDGKAFLDEYQHEDKQIAKGILWQTLATEESRTMARAASQQHMDIFGIGISFMRGIITDAIKMDILAQAIIYNYGEQYLYLMPEVSLGGVGEQDFARNATAVGTLSSARYLHYSQYPGIDRFLNLPERDMEAVEAEEQQKQASLTAAQIANPGGNQPGSGDGGSGGNFNPAKDNSPNFDTEVKVGQNG